MSYLRRYQEKVIDTEEGHHDQTIASNGQPVRYFVDK